MMNELHIVRYTSRRRDRGGGLPKDMRLLILLQRRSKLRLLAVAVSSKVGHFV